eukprot:1196183-Prorocentrum_minimum.AAC.2
MHICSAFSNIYMRSLALAFSYINDGQRKVTKARSRRNFSDSSVLSPNCSSRAEERVSFPPGYISLYFNMVPSVIRTYGNASLEPSSNGEISVASITKLYVVIRMNQHNNTF